jgi:NADPH-dependent ferric siderophore reductase
MSAKGKLVRWLGGALLKRATIAEARDVGTFRRLLLRGDVGPFTAGAKLQVLLASDDVRTYTPIATEEGMVLLGWKSAGGPGARWMASAATGEEVRFLGPQRSLELASGPVLLVGDETSVAVAAAFARERAGRVHAVFATDAEPELRAAAASVGLERFDVVAREDAAGASARVAELHAEQPAATLALTGGSELVVRVRDALRTRGLTHAKAKAYWIPGRAGVD